MSMILLAVEDAERDAPIRDLLTAEGWWVTTVASKAEALRAAADHAPQLLILDHGMEDSAGVARVFSRQEGGCGVLVLVDSMSDEPAGDLGDGVIARDQNGDAVVALVRGSLDAPRAAPDAAAPVEGSAGEEDQLTASELFGDILEDLGGEAAGAADETTGPTEVDPASAGESADESAGDQPQTAVESPAVEPADDSGETESNASPTEEPAVDDVEVAGEGGEEEVDVARGHDEGNVVDSVHADVEQALSGLEETADSPIEFESVELEPQAEPASEEEPETQETVESETDATLEVPSGASSAAVEDEAGASDETATSDESAPADAELASVEDELASVEIEEQAGVDDEVAPAETELPDESVVDADDEDEGEEEVSTEDEIQRLVDAVATPDPDVEDMEDEEAAVSSALHLAPPLGDGELEDGEPTTDLMEDLAGILDSSDEPYTSDDTDSGEGLSIDEVLAVEESIEDEEAGDEVSSGDDSDQESAADEASQAEDDDDAHERVGAYELLELVEFGDVTERWLARRAGEEGETVVLERVRFELRNRADVRDAFVEGNSDAAGWEHDNVLSVVDLGRDGDIDFVATEFHKGRSLSEVLDRVARMEGRMPLGVSLLLIERLAAALEVLAEGPPAARLGWLVPASVWLTEEGDVLLREFGVGRLGSQDDSLVRDWQQHRFTAPEKFHQRGDIRSDLYSLGALLYEMITGRPVYRADDFDALVEAVSAGKIAAAQEVDPTIPTEIDSWVMRLLRSSPEERPQSVSDVMAKIDLALQALPARPANAELNAYVRQLFAARVPDRPAPASAAVALPEGEGDDVELADETDAVEEGTTTLLSRINWWWLLIPLLAALAGVVGWMFMGGGGDPTAGLPGAPEMLVARASPLVLPLAIE